LILKLKLTCAGALAVALAGCSTLPQPRDDGALQREAMAGTEKRAPRSVLIPGIYPATPGVPPPEVTTGTGVFVKAVRLAKPPPVAAGRAR
jgi:general secretion pathway protein D